MLPVPFTAFVNVFAEILITDTFPFSLTNFQVPSRNLEWNVDTVTNVVSFDAFTKVVDGANTKNIRSRQGYFLFIFF